MLYSDIYKPISGSCSNFGISSKFNEVCVVNVAGPNYIKPQQDRPAVIIVKGNLENTVKAVPAQWNEEEKRWEPQQKQWMFGGCFIYDSDSRFREVVCYITNEKSATAVPLHDRCQ